LLQDSSDKSDASLDHAPVVSQQAKSKASSSRLKESLAQAKTKAKEAKDAQKALNQKIKEQAVELKKEREQFRKWRHTHKEEGLTKEMDSTMMLPNSKAKKQQVGILVQRFKDEVLSKPNKETIRRSIAKTKKDSIATEFTSTLIEHNCEV
jgi:hypothetical protein